jgi:hypothetical protein
MTEHDRERRANRRLAVLRHVEEVSFNVAATVWIGSRAGGMRPFIQDDGAAPGGTSQPSP